jgi:hypothetical protein
LNLFSNPFGVIEIQFLFQKMNLFFGRKCLIAQNPLKMAQNLPKMVQNTHEMAQNIREMA